MLKNEVYNLMCQLTQEHKSLWRINNFYLKDGSECPECTEFWKKLAKDKEEHISDLTALIKKHI